jgi:hypothetical protein
MYRVHMVNLSRARDAAQVLAGKASRRRRNLTEDGHQQARRWADRQMQQLDAAPGGDLPTKS